MSQARLELADDADGMSDQNPDIPSWAVPSPSTAGKDEGPVGSESASSSPGTLPSVPVGATPSPEGTVEASLDPEPVPPSRIPRSRWIAGGVAVVAALGLGGFLAGTALADGRGDGQAVRAASGSRGDAPGEWPGGMDPNQPGQGLGVPGGAPDGPGTGGQRGHGFDDARMTAGVITSVTDGRLVVRTRDNASVTVVTTAQTVVRGSTATTVAALKVGDLVFVQGTRAADGSYTAAQIAVGMPPRGGHGGGDRPGSGDHDGDDHGGSGAGSGAGSGTVSSGVTT